MPQADIIKRFEDMQMTQHLRVGIPPERNMMNHQALQSIWESPRTILSKVFARGLNDGEFFRTLTKKPTMSLENLLASAEKYAPEEVARMKGTEAQIQSKNKKKVEHSLKRPRSEDMEKGDNCYSRHTPLKATLVQELMGHKNCVRWPSRARPGLVSTKPDKYC
ncbi:hypothetical protein BUALT_Bualt17G0005200 [Buddleja alternifolia]|uniref:Uncharacterized protein n=1 Tax=Buddleja alternifolia TaxID=168488 RepID=A0AAV6W594_9LAMI|nr:hypothetical protein BUALT_Bualt17G0005200 [Buddleja alternifolia]